MRILPILFSSPMVSAILEGRKTQTRRVIKKRYSNTDIQWKKDKYGTRLVERQNDVPPPVKNPDESTTYNVVAFSELRPTYSKGDILWVRESFLICNENEFLQGMNSRFVFKASIHPDWFNALKEAHPSYKWIPSIHMPKAACRIFLKVTNVKAERLHDISGFDATCEGILPKGDYYKSYTDNVLYADPQSSFFSLWESINGAESLLSNPWVWVYSFERCEMPKNFLS